MLGSRLAMDAYFFQKPSTIILKMILLEPDHIKMIRTSYLIQKLINEWTKLHFIAYLKPVTL